MINVRQLEYHVGSFRLQPADLTVASGEYFVLLGPPGSGKSIFLECLCGLRSPTGGSISIHGRDVTRLEPRRRGIGYLPQNYGLFPHLSVRRNIAFGIRGRADRDERVENMAEWLGIGRLLKRRIDGLSGGERQNVALARALVLEPEILLLDEPVSALDEATRQDVCMELKALHRKLGITTVHISHNREEAYTVADKAAILRDGKLQQIGTMAELSRKPATEYVARFMRCENILHGRATPVDSRDTEVQVGGTSFHIPGRFDGDVALVIRPELVRVLSGEEAKEPGANRLAGTITHIQDRGTYFRVEFEGRVSLVAHLAALPLTQLRLCEGRPAQVHVDGRAIHVLQEKGLSR